MNHADFKYIIEKKHKYSVPDLFVGDKMFCYVVILLNRNCLPMDVLAQF